MYTVGRFVALQAVTEDLAACRAAAPIVPAIEPTVSVCTTRKVGFMCQEAEFGIGTIELSTLKSTTKWIAPFTGMVNPRTILSPVSAPLGIVSGMLLGEAQVVVPSEHTST